MNLDWCNPVFKPSLNFLTFNKAVRARRYIERLKGEFVFPQTDDEHLNELMRQYDRLLRKSVTLGAFATLFAVLAYVGIITANLESLGMAGLMPGVTRLLNFASSIVGGSVCLLLFLTLNWFRNLYINDSNIMAAHIISHVVVHGHMRNAGISLNHKKGRRAKTV